MRDVALLAALCAAFLAVGLVREPTTCRTVLRFSRNGKHSTREGALFAFLMGRP